MGVFLRGDENEFSVAGELLAENPVLMSFMDCREIGEGDGGFFIPAS